MSDLISRQDAINCCACLHPEECWDEIRKLPSADRSTTDCTKFLEWLKAEVLDEENWELNAVANGEVICRKFRKLGWLDVEDGYYVDTRPTVDKEYLIDLIQEAVYDGEACAKLIDLVDRPTGEWISEELANMICDEICYYKEVTVDANSLNDLCEGCLIKKMKYDKPTGKWIKSDILPNGWHCSHCDAPVMTDDIDEMLFCPNCGAKMKGADDED